MIAVALAGRYATRHELAALVDRWLRPHADLLIVADWLTETAESDEAMSDAQALERISRNMDDLFAASVLLYVPDPVLSPGRMADVGMARLLHLPIVSIGAPEPTIYLRGAVVTDWEHAAEACRQAGGG